MAVKKILIVDDLEVVREGIKRIFDEECETVALGPVATAAEAVSLARDEEWDVAVLDLSLVLACILKHSCRAITGKCRSQNPTQ